MEPLPHDAERVASFLLGAKRILFITGAGLSADSGMPTYRGVGGLYGDVPVREGLTIEDMLSGYMMRTNPSLVWEYLSHLAGAFNAAEPNQGHRVIAEMEAEFESVWVLTQNVDGLHRRAGSTNIIDIHGDIHGLACLKCAFEQRQVILANLKIPPKCPQCGEILRPTVVLFGEMLAEGKVAELQNQIFRGFDVVFSVGTSSLFPYITQPVTVLGQRGAKTIEINPALTELSNLVDVKMNARAASSLDAIWRAYHQRQKAS